MGHVGKRLNTAGENELKPTTYTRENIGSVGKDLRIELFPSLKLNVGLYELEVGLSEEKTKRKGKKKRETKGVLSSAYSPSQRQVE